MLLKKDLLKLLVNDDYYLVLLTTPYGKKYRDGCGSKCGGGIGDYHP